MSLYPHQEKFLSENPNNAILCYETGTGKTHTAKLWRKLSGRDRNTIIICPKQIRSDWKDDCPDATVYSFEDFLKADLPSNPSAIVVDEADAMASPLFVAKARSKRTEKLYHYVMANPNVHILLLTATPVRSSPWNIHTLLVLARIKPADTWKKYRDIYFSLENKPFLPRPAWLPKKGWQKMMQPLIDKYTYTALMSDLVDLPPVTNTIIKLTAPEYEENDEWEPMAQFVADHRLEQQSKCDEIKRLTKGIRKAVIVAHYREQIDALRNTLGKERHTLVIDGRTGDAQSVVAEAEAVAECYLIIQASVGAGFELHTFSTMIFASQGYSVRNWVQMTGRIRRIKSLKPVWYYYLLGGRCDKMVYDSIQKGKDFVPSEYRRTA